MTLHNFPPADQCTPEDIDAIADLVVREPRASYDLAGSRDHIEALCRRYQALAQDLAVERECSAPLLPAMTALERALAAATNDLDSARTEIRALQSTLDAERNERQAEVLQAEADRAELAEIRQTRALDDQLRSTTRAITGRDYEVVQQDLDAELAAHPDPGPLHHARDQRDHTEDTTP